MFFRFFVVLRRKGLHIVSSHELSVPVLIKTTEKITNSLPNQEIFLSF